MSQIDNTPITSPSSGAAGPAGWIPVWIKAVTQPNEQTFIDITESPEALPKTAYIWIFIIGTILGIIIGLILAWMGSAVFALTDSFNPRSETVFGRFLIGAICISPMVGGLYVLFFTLGVAIIQQVAKLFGGSGTYDKLVYAMATITVPISLISMLVVPFTLVPFSVTPYLGICTGLISLGLIFYALALQITAVKAVNRFGWGQATGSVLLPGVVIIVVCGCIVIGGLMLMGPAFGDIFSGINQSLQSVP